GDLAGGRQRSFEIAAGAGPSLGETQVDAMGDREPFKAAARARGDLPQPAQALRQLIGFHARAVIAVAQFDRADGRAAAEAAHPDWDRAAGRARSESHVREGEESSPKIRLLTGPQGAHEPDGLVGQRAALL